MCVYTYIVAYISLYYSDEQTNKSVRQMMTHAWCIMRHHLSHTFVSLLKTRMRQNMTHGSFSNEQTDKRMRTKRTHASLKKHASSFSHTCVGLLVAERSMRHHLSHTFVEQTYKSMRQMMTHA